VSDRSQFVLISTGLGSRPEVLDPADLRELYAQTQLGHVLDAALSIVRNAPDQTLLPAVDRRSWLLSQTNIDRWETASITVVRATTDSSATLVAIEDVALLGDLADVSATFLDIARSELTALRSRAMEARRHALEVLAREENVDAAQQEIVRLSIVAQRAEAIASSGTVAQDIQSDLRDVVTACESATTTLSASLTAALLVVQHRGERADADRRKLIEDGQRRIAATAAALVLPTIVVGFAGANFFQPGADSRLWTGLLTVGLSVILAVIGVRVAQTVATAGAESIRRAALSAAVFGAALVVASVVLAWRSG
jgi:hypothetical protein